MVGGCTASGGAGGDDDGLEPDPGPLLTRVDAEPVGANCPAGGTAVRTGHDGNRDGALGDAEVETTAYTCAERAEAEVWPGDFRRADWENPAAVAALLRAHAVLGTLEVPAGTATALPALERIGADLSLAGSVAPAAFPALVSIGGDLFPSGLGLTGVALPALASLGGSLRLSSLSYLTRVSLPRLRSVGGDFAIVGSNALAALELTALEEVGGRMFLSALPALRVLDLPALRAVNGSMLAIIATNVEKLVFSSLVAATYVYVESNDELRSVTLPVLDTVGAVAVLTAPQLERLSAPQLEALDALTVMSGPRTVMALPRLTTVRESMFLENLGELSELPALTTVGWLSIRNSGARDLRALSALRRVDTLWIIRNAALESLAGLDGLGQLAAALWIIDNPALSSLAGLEHVTRAGDVHFIRNASLATLALPSLATIDKSLRIERMASLADLSGLAALMAVFGDIDFVANPLLSPDEIAAFRGRF